MKTVPVLNIFHFHSEPTFYLDKIFIFFSHKKVKFLLILKKKVLNCVYSKLKKKKHQNQSFNN